MRPTPDVLHDFFNGDKERHVQFNKERRNYFISAIIIVLLNSLGFPVAIEAEGSYWSNVFVGVLTFGLMVTATGFLLGFIVALPSNRGFPYSKRYLNAALLATIGLQLLFTLLMIVLFIYALSW